ncbi:MAG: P-type conjugative transfer protein TrbL, partial [Burkholderiaceae bacterium]|nr:P-type conjugative transfer protein TrbL [Burkholderiaceae bacterium]
ISLVWTGGMMLLRKADIGEFFAEFFRFIFFTGLFWWMLINGPAMAIAIIDSMRAIGAAASGGPLASPSGIVDIGFAIFAKVLDKSTVWSPIASAIGIVLSIIILLVLALVAVNMLLLMISAWVLAYAGIFFLGFGGARWTSEIAIGYFKTVLDIAAQILVMTLLVGIGKSFIDDYYTHMGADLKMTEMAVIMVVAVILLALVNKLPPMVGGLAHGGGAGPLGGGFGAGSIMAAAAMGAAAVASAGSALAAGAANVGGGMQALKAAVAMASAEDGGNSDSSGGQASGGSGAGSGNASFAAAMGDAQAQGAQSSGAGQQGSSGSQSEKGTANADSKQKSGGANIAAGAAGHLVSGVVSMAKANMNKRIAATPGGKLAQAIRDTGRGNQQTPARSGGQAENTLSAGAADDSDPEAEVQAYMDRHKPDDDDGNAAKGT